MCCLFGIHDYAGYFNNKQKNIILSVLSAECEVRGTDATGIAYNAGGGLRIFKRPLPARHMVYLTPNNVKVIMGHTRMTTQGDEARNYNNHPFYGTSGDTTFAFAHNGIIYNDTELRKAHKLPQTKIQTDSYVAVQLLEQEPAVNFQSLARMAEAVRGSFTFSVLDNNDNLHFVKGDNPLAIYHFASRGYYLYASTDVIMDSAIQRLGLDKWEHETVPCHCGDIICISAGGAITTAAFDTDELRSLHYGYFRPYRYSLYEDFRDFPDEEHLRTVREMAGAFGYSPDDIDELLTEGYTLDEIEDVFYEGEDVSP